MRMPSVRLTCLLAVSASLWLAGCDKKDPAGPFKAPTTPTAEAATVGSSSKAFNSVDITGANYAQQFSLTDTEGKKRTLAEFKGKVVFVFFGFTQCPEVCPVTMAELAEVRRRLGKDGDKVQGVFITIDPERDTAPVLKEYLHAMDPGFVGLRGSLEETNAASREFKVFYQKVPTKDGKSYSMDHTAGGFVFDPKGRIRLFARYGQPVDALTADIKKLLGS